MTNPQQTCPRCGSVDLAEFEGGPDSWDDDVTFTYLICQSCGLAYDGWTKEWYEGVTHWTEFEGAIVWQPPDAGDGKI